MRILIFCTLFLVPSISNAQTFGRVGTRAEGMGGAFVAVADDATAVYWNPAGLASGALFDFQVSRVDGPPGPSLFVGATLPVLGLSFYRTHTVQASPDRQNEGSGKVPTRTLTTSNTGITFVQTAVSTLVVGTTARIVRGGVDAMPSRTTVDFDAGAMWSAPGSIRLGVTSRNLREPEFGHELGPFKMKRQVRAGVALAPRSSSSGVYGPFSVAFDADLTKTTGPEGALRMVAFGGEYWLFAGRLGARAGVRWHTLGNPDEAFSGGITVKLPSSIFIEGHMTESVGQSDPEWSVGGRVTF